MSVTIQNLTLTNSYQSTGYGGAIYNHGGILTVNNLVLSNNAAGLAPTSTTPGATVKARASSTTWGRSM